jgi:hypothetical protein
MELMIEAGFVDVNEQVLKVGDIIPFLACLLSAFDLGLL